MKIQKIILKELLPFLAICFFALSLLFNNFSSSVKNGLSLYACVVLPSVFPFFFITAYLSRLNITKLLLKKSSPFFYKTFKINHFSGFAFIIGLISGYPLGSKLIADLSEGGFIDKSEAERACCLASNPSPVFSILSLGTVMFGDARFGAKVYLICVTSSIIVGLIFCRTKKTENINPKDFRVRLACDTAYDSAYSAFTTALLVGTLITIFYVFTDVLAFYGVLLPVEKVFTLIFKDQKIAEGVTYSIFESSKGLKILAEKPNSFFSLPIVCAVLSFGGLSVIMQSTTFLKKAKIKTTPFILSKILCAVLSFFIALIVNFL